MAFGYAVIPSGRMLRTLLLEGIERLSEEQRLEREKTSAVLLRLIGNFRNAIIQNVFLGLLFAYWPWLRSYYMYMFAFQGAIMCCLIALNASILGPPPRNMKEKGSNQKESRASSKEASLTGKPYSKVGLNAHLTSPSQQHQMRQVNNHKTIELTSLETPSGTLVLETMGSKIGDSGKGEDKTEVDPGGTSSLDNSVSDAFQEYQNPLLLNFPNHQLEAYPEGEEKEEEARLS